MRRISANKRCLLFFWRSLSVLLVVLTIDVYFTGIIPPPLKKLYRPISGTKLPTIQQPLQNPEISQVDAKIRDQTALLESNTQLDKVAIIVPYKNRSKHLLKFLTHMLPFLRKQRRRYVIIIAEQAGNASFNRAKLFNVAVKEIRKSPAGDRLHGIDCFILHDVDKVPTSSSAVYTCGQNVRQLVNAFRSGNKTRWWYRSFLGAATAFTLRHVEQINGASNVFYGWGGEDDELAIRLRLNKIPVVRSRGNAGIFEEFDAYHPRDKNPDRRKLLTERNTTSTWKHDGIKQTRYNLLSRHDYKHFIWILALV
uniref:Beta-1,4-galactosyltransferase n=1 Tax=Schistocephalus solidus TaxID=70667 RepID=A0A0X3NQA2_SCHSO